MNNLQYLYSVNDDFQRLITSHLVICERWYKDELGEASIDDDFEAHNWLMAERYDSGSDFNDEKLPDPCLRLDCCGSEFASVELGDGTGFVRADQAAIDFGVMRDYARKLVDVLKETYGFAVWVVDGIPDDRKTAGDLADMNRICKELRELGIEV